MARSAADGSAALLYRATANLLEVTGAASLCELQALLMAVVDQRPSSPADH